MSSRREDIANWLKNHQLQHYLDVFLEQDVSVELLADFDSDDLRELGLTLGDRKRFLRAVAAITPASRPAHGAAPLVDSEAERRQLTVMFVDLVGSTALAEALDPEDMSDLVRAYQAGVQRCVERYRGYVSRYMGDGVLIYFGWPMASEDDASRAIRTALEITRETSRLNAPGGRALACRCGIATGLVVVGEMIGIGSSQEHAVVGETPNLAARLQGLAAENSTVVSDTTRRVAGNHFLMQSLGLHQLKGIREPVAAFSVLDTREVESRYLARQRGQTLPMVGREFQISALQRHWSAARAGEKRIVVLRGEAGIGKSRLLYAFFDLLVGVRHTQSILQCDPVRSDSALYPASALINRLADIQIATTEQQRLQKLQQVSAPLPDVQLHDARAAVYPLLASMLGIESDGIAACLSHLNARQKKQLTLSALCLVLERSVGTDTPVVSERPALYVLEDAHWADPTTLELLQVMLQRATDRGVLLLVTARPEFQIERLKLEPLDVIEIGKLEKAYCHELIASVAGQRSLSKKLLAQIVKRTDGIPLYAEELTKTIVEAESDNADLQPGQLPADVTLDIPESLYESLMARLDRLPSVREVAQTAACLGREFQADQLRAIMQLDSEFLEPALQSLGRAEVIFRGDGQTCVFKHALLRDAAYESLLKSKRQQIHRRTAKVLLQNHASIVATQPELVAYHLQHASDFNEASGYWLQAATLALQRVANLEAVAHANAGLQCLAPNGEGEDNQERPFRQRRYELLFARGMGSMALHGYAADSVRDSFNEAMQLADDIADAERYSQAARGVVTADIVSSRFADALQLADAMLKRAETPMQNFYALRMQGQIYLWQARFHDSRLAFEHAIELYDSSHHSPLAQWDDGVLSIGFLGITMTCLGHTDAGEALHRQSIEMAENLNQPFSICQAMESWITSILLRDDDFSEVLQRFGDVADQHQMVFFQACARLYQGIQIIRAGSPEQGVKIANDGLELYRACQSMLGVPKWITYVAEGYLQAGDHSKASPLLDEAWQVMNELNNDYFRAEWLRIKALTAAQSDVNDGRVVEAFMLAITRAESQGAKLFALTATIDLVQLQQRRGHAPASEQLQNLIDRFQSSTTFRHLERARILSERLAAVS